MLRQRLPSEGLGKRKGVLCVRWDSFCFLYIFTLYCSYWFVLAFNQEVGQTFSEAGISPSLLLVKVILRGPQTAEGSLRDRGVG